jgi:hypothetical protein
MQTISHGRIEAELLSIKIDVTARLWNVRVKRINAVYWTVAGGRPQMELESIDALMRAAGFRAVAGVAEAAA